MFLCPGPDLRPPARPRRRLPVPPEPEAPAVAPGVGEPTPRSRAPRPTGASRRPSVQFASCSLPSFSVKVEAQAVPSVLLPHPRGKGPQSRPPAAALAGTLCFPQTLGFAIRARNRPCPACLQSRLPSSPLAPSALPEVFRSLRLAPALRAARPCATVRSPVSDGVRTVPIFTGSRARPFRPGLQASVGRHAPRRLVSWRVTMGLFRRCSVNMMTLREKTTTS